MRDVSGTVTGRERPVAWAPETVRSRDWNHDLAEPAKLCFRLLTAKSHYKA